MPGVSLEHDRTVRSVLRLLEERLPRECEPLTADMRVRLTESRYVYPDVTVACGELLFADAEVDTLANPVAVFEALSESTMAFDLGEKVRLYRNLESLQTLCLMAQDRPWVEVWTRDGADRWIVREFTGPSAAAELPALELALPLAELYRRVPFSAVE